MKATLGRAVVLGLMVVSFVACGGGGGDGGTPSVTYKFFAYVTNAGSDDISAYGIDTVTGAWAEIAGSPFPAGPFSGSFPCSIAIDPAGKFAFVANENHSNISVFAINAATGALTAIAGSPYPTAPNPVRAAVDPKGQVLYVANRYGNSVSVYAINSVTGALTEIAGSPFGAGGSPTGLALSPSGNFVYVSNYTIPGLVSAYAADAATGGLTEIPGSPFTTGDMAISVAVDPTGKFAYVVYWDSNIISSFISAYAIDAGTGSLALVTGSPYPTGLTARYAAVEPKGKYAYVVNQDSENVSAYSIDAQTGALVEISGSPFARLNYPMFIAFDPTGTFAYVANVGVDTVSAFRINANTGALAAIAGSSSFTAGSAPYSIATVRIKQ